MTNLTRNPKKRLHPARNNLAAAVLIMAGRMAAAERDAAIYHCYDPNGEEAARLSRAAARRSRALARLVVALAEAAR